MIGFHMFKKLQERLHILSRDMEDIFLKDPNKASGDEYYTV